MEQKFSTFSFFCSLIPMKALSLGHLFIKTIWACNFIVSLLRKSSTKRQKITDSLILALIFNTINFEEGNKT